MKLRTKIILYFLLPIFLLDAGGSALSLKQTVSALKELAEKNFDASTQNIAAELSRMNEQGVTLASAAAVAATEMGFGNRSANVSYIRHLLEAFPAYVGASIGYEPNIDGQDEFALIALNNLKNNRPAYEGGGVDSYNFTLNKSASDINTWIEKSQGGRFLTYWGRKGQQWMLEPLEGMDTAMYYAGLKKKFDAGSKEAFIITEPYFYKDTELMIEYSSPIVVDEKFGGQVAFDRSLEFIADMLKGLKTLDGSEFFLISPFDRVIASTIDNSAATISIDDFFLDARGNLVTDFLRKRDGQLVRDPALAANADFSKYKTLYRDLLKSVSDDESMAVNRIRSFKDPQTGLKYCVAHSRVAPGGWTLVQVVPDTEIYAPIYNAIKNEAYSMLVFLLAVFLIAFLLKNFTKDMELATAAAEKISQGDLTENLNEASASGDEAGRLVASFSKMTHSLRSLINQVKHSSIQIGGASGGIESASSEYESRVQNFGALTGQISAAVKEVNASNAELYKTLSQLAGAAGSSADIADSGRKQLGNMERTMTWLSKNTQVIARSLGVINQKANNINSVITAISKVADETNLLSLNAAIEAEKAGSYGVGFAVVAREIGRLSDQTAMATSDIEVIVKDMQSAVGAGVMEMDRFSEEVRLGVVEVGKIILSMDGIITQMQEIAPQIENLTEAMQAQSINSGQINQAMSNLNDSAKQTAALLGEFAHARAQLHEAISNLRDEIAKFKLTK